MLALKELERNEEFEELEEWDRNERLRNNLRIEKLILEEINVQLLVAKLSDERRHGKDYLNLDSINPFLIRCFIFQNKYYSLSDDKHVQKSIEAYNYMKSLELLNHDNASGFNDNASEIILKYDNLY